MKERTRTEMEFYSLGIRVRVVKWDSNLVNSGAKWKIGNGAMNMEMEKRGGEEGESNHNREGLGVIKNQGAGLAEGSHFEGLVI